MTASSNSSGLYVHVPFCDGKCHYCAFYSLPYSRPRAEAWLEAVQAELAAARRLLPHFAPETLFMGGGTPSMLEPDLLESLLELINRMVVPQPSREWTCEANPGSLDTLKSSLLRDHGVNRISLGVQSLADPVLQRLGRRHSASDVLRSVSAIQEAGYDNWNLDLIACVPGVGLDAWRRTLLDAVALGSPHLSVYSLTRDEGSRLACEIGTGRSRLLDDEEQLQMLDEAEAILTREGFRRYEISNYARPGFECRHNLSCWRGENYLGLGCAASSRLGRRRWTNPPDLASYADAWKGAGQTLPATADTEELTPETDALERLIFGLRMAEGVNLDAILTVTGLQNSSHGTRWNAILVRLEKEGLLQGESGRWWLTARGRALADHVAVELIP